MVFLFALNDSRLCKMRIDLPSDLVLPMALNNTIQTDVFVVYIVMQQILNTIVSVCALECFETHKVAVDSCRLNMNVNRMIGFAIFASNLFVTMTHDQNVAKSEASRCDIDRCQVANHCRSGNLIKFCGFLWMITNDPSHWRVGCRLAFWLASCPLNSWCFRTMRKSNEQKRYDG